MQRIALAGRPNVGKSSLFNRLAGRALALVEDTPGVTRDWIEAPIRLRGHELALIDTAGLEAAPPPRASAAAAGKGAAGAAAGAGTAGRAASAPPAATRSGRRAQAELEKRIAVHNWEVCAGADLIWFMVDGRAGLLAEDEALLLRLRRLGRPLLLLVNKAEGGRGLREASSEWQRLGLGEGVALSAAHSLGLEELAEATLAALGLPDTGVAGEREGEAQEGEEGAQEEAEGEEESAAAREGAEDRPLSLAIIGRPNTGKSTLANRLLGARRQIVSDVAGTTRDAVALEAAGPFGRLHIVDTAGLRRRGKVGAGLERRAGARSLAAVDQAEQVWLVLDAASGVERQDLILAARTMEEGRALLVVLNKSDAVASPEGARLEAQERLRRSLSQSRGVPVAVVSALEGAGMEALLAESRRLHELWTTRLPTARLNRWLAEAVAARPPPAPGGRRLRLKYITQHKARPPSFMLACSAAPSPAYLRYLENQLREAFSLYGVPLRFHCKTAENPYR